MPQSDPIPRLPVPQLPEAKGLPEIGAIVADKYRIVRLIGRGGTGAVFQAGHLVTGKQLALKYLVPRGEPSPDEIERFIREARTAGRVAHPNIVDIYDVGEQGGSFFLVMELLRGRPLRDWMRIGPLEPGPLLRSVLPALRGVHAAHRAGIVHRDLKPENVFLCSDHDGELLTAKVLDFGISKVGESAGITLSSITRTGVVMGTPYYMSPEQAEDSSSVDHRTDVYACGVMLYEALSATLPYRADSLTSLLLRIARGDALPLRKLRPDLPAPLESAVMRAMARDPAERFADMRALIAALEPFAGDRPLPLTPDSAESGGWLAERMVTEADASDERTGLRKRAPWLLAALALLVGAAIAARFAQEAGADPGSAATPAQPPRTQQQQPPAPAPPLPTPPVPAPPAPVPPEETKAITAEVPPAPPRAPMRAVTRPRVPGSSSSPTPTPTPTPTPDTSAKSALGPQPPDAVPALPAPRGKLGIDMRSDQF